MYYSYKRAVRICKCAKGLYRRYTILNKLSAFSARRWRGKYTVIINSGLSLSASVGFLNDAPALFRDKMWTLYFKVCNKFLFNEGEGINIGFREFS